jgi:hypothetical protein
LQRVQKFMHINVVSPKSLDVVFKRIDFAIKKISGVTYYLFIFYSSVIIFYIYNYDILYGYKRSGY